MSKNLIITNYLYNYRQAWDYAKEKGKTLISHPVLAEGVRKDTTITYPILARELVAYPEANGQFKYGKDIFDEVNKVIIPWSSVKDLDIFRPNIGLFIDPRDLEISEKDNVVIIPKSIIVLENFIQENRDWVQINKLYPTDKDGSLTNVNWGQIDKKTGIPLKVSKEVFDTLPDDKKGQFFRSECLGIHPLARVHSYDGHVLPIPVCYDHKSVIAEWDMHELFRVAFEEDTVSHKK